MNDAPNPLPHYDATVIHASGGPLPASAPPAGDGGNAMPLGSVIGEFEITRVLGEGGFGIVYLARDHALERWVALKEYMPSSLALRGEGAQVMVRSPRHRDTFAAGLKSFINEARLLAQFDHRSLVKVYRFWEAGGTAYMVMPFVEGQTLKDTLRALGSAPSEDWLMGLLQPLTEALQVLHAENCYHRDIAPDNIILVAGSGLPLLLDFGAARRVIGDMTQALTVILKPGYAPIEQYAEVPSMRQGPWTDVYALAAVVYFAITGRTPPASVGRLVSDDYQPLVQVAAGQYSESLLRAVDRALRVKPDERTASIADFRADLGLAPQAGQGAVDGPTLMPRPPGAMPSTTPPEAQPATQAAAASVRRRPMWPGLVGVGIAMAGLAGYWLMNRPAASPVATVARVEASSSHQANPAAAPTPTLPPAAAAASLPQPTVQAPVITDMLAQFDQVLAGQSAGFNVSAEAASTRLRIDRDELHFRVTSARDGHVFVLLYGPDGTLSQIFPNSKSKGHRIQANQPLNLPQANWPLKASDPAGMEQFLVVVTAEPRTLAPLATGKDSDYGFLQLPTAAPAVPGAPGLPWLLGQPDCGHAACSTDYGAARFSVAAVK